MAGTARLRLAWLAAPARSASAAAAAAAAPPPAARAAPLLRLAVVRVPASHPVPRWALDALVGAPGSRDTPLVSVTRTREEVSVVLPEALLPRAAAEGAADGGHLEVEGGWCAVRVVGRLEFSQVGVLAGLSAALARARVSLLAASTFDTDYLLVKEADVPAARAALEASKYEQVELGAEECADATAPAH